MARAEPRQPRRPPGRLPSRETLMRRDVPQLQATLRRMGITVNVGAMRARIAASPAVRRLTAALEATADLPRRFRAEAIAGLQEALAERMATDLQRQLRQQALEAVRQLHLRETGARGESLMIWVTVGPDEKTCNSCEPRHGEQRTLRTWQRRGMPGSPVLLCNGNCRCRLLPAAWFAGEAD